MKCISYSYTPLHVAHSTNNHRPEDVSFPCLHLGITKQARYFKGKYPLLKEAAGVISTIHRIPVKFRPPSYTTTETCFSRVLATEHYDMYRKGIPYIKVLSLERDELKWIQMLLRQSTIFLLFIVNSNSES